MSGLSIIWLCLPFNIEKLVHLTMVTEYIFIGSTVLGLLWLRHTQPNLTRPMKVNLVFPIVFVIICLVLITMKIYYDPREALICISVIGIGIPVYWVFVLLKKPKWLDDKISKMIGKLYGDILLKFGVNYRNTPFFAR